MFENLNKKVVIVTALSIIAVVVIVFNKGVFSGSVENNKLVTRNIEAVQNDLEVARENLQTETNKLYTLMLKSGEYTPTQQASVEGYLRDKLAVARTDILFNNPNSDNPTIKIKLGDTSIEAEINNWRADVLSALKKWGSLTTSAQTDWTSLSDSAVTGALTVQSYLAELHEVIGNLTEENSSLDPGVISSYQNIVANAGEEANAVVNYLVESSHSFSVNVINPNIPVSENNQNEDSTITNQQEVINQAQSVVDNLEQELNQTTNTESNINTANETPATQNENIVDNTHNVNVNDTPVNNSRNYDPVADPLAPLDPSILVQPGSPKLIQGMNQN